MGAQQILFRNAQFYFTRHDDEEPIMDTKKERELTLADIANKEEVSGAYKIKIIHLSNEIQFKDGNKVLFITTKANINFTMKQFRAWLGARISPIFELFKNYQFEKEGCPLSSKQEESYNLKHLTTRDQKDKKFGMVVNLVRL